MVCNVVKRKKARFSIMGCRVHVEPHLIGDQRFVDHWQKLRGTQSTWSNATWTALVRREIRLRWNGGNHGGNRSRNQHGCNGYRRPTNQCAETALTASAGEGALSANGGAMHNHERRDDSCTGHVELGSSEVAGQLVADLAQPPDGACPRTEQPEALVPATSANAGSLNIAMAKPRLAKLRTHTLIEKLGAGSFGDVHKCMFGRRRWAVKIKKSHGATDNEVTVLKLLGDSKDHPNVVKLIYWRRQLATSEFHLYFRLYALDLRDCMRKHAAANTHLGHIAIMRMACGLCAGLGFVHSRHVIHRDLTLDFHFH